MHVVVQDLDNETLAHIDAENRRQTLEEQIEFLKSIHDQVRLIMSNFTEICAREKFLQCFDAAGWAAGRASGL